MKIRFVYAALALVVPVLQTAQAGDCWDCSPVATVPEPATIGLLAAGVGALAFMRSLRGRK